VNTPALTNHVPVGTVSYVSSVFFFSSRLRSKSKGDKMRIHNLRYGPRGRGQEYI